MPRKYQVVANQTFEGVGKNGTLRERISYDDVRFSNSLFQDCTWDHCKFHRTSFTHGTVFRNCRFVGCHFRGQHTCLGGPSRFEHCEFSDCRFENVQFWKTTLVGCRLSGKIVNVVFYGPKAPEGWRSVFDHVDLSGMTLEDVDFRLEFNLKTVVLPRMT